MISSMAVRNIIFLSVGGSDHCATLRRSSRPSNGCWLPPPKTESNAFLRGWKAVAGLSRSLPAFHSIGAPAQQPPNGFAHPPHRIVQRPALLRTAVARVCLIKQRVVRHLRNSVLRWLSYWLLRQMAISPLAALDPAGDLLWHRQSRCSILRRHHSRPCTNNARESRCRPSSAHEACGHSDHSAIAQPGDPGPRESPSSIPRPPS